MECIEATAGLELLPDRYVDPDEIARIRKEVPGLRDYKPLPEHIRAVDVRHVRHALNEIGRANCPEEIKREQRRRLSELAQKWPGMVEEVQECLKNAECRAP